jgi:hypothetical protein
MSTGVAAQLKAQSRKLKAGGATSHWGSEVRGASPFEKGGLRGIYSIKSPWPPFPKGGNTDLDLPELFNHFRDRTLAMAAPGDVPDLPSIR